MVNLHPEGLLNYRFSIKTGQATFGVRRRIARSWLVERKTCPWLIEIPFILESVNHDRRQTLGPNQTIVLTGGGVALVDIVLEDETVSRKTSL